MPAVTFFDAATPPIFALAAAALYAGFLRYGLRLRRRLLNKGKHGLVLMLAIASGGVCIFGAWIVISGSRLVVNGGWQLRDLQALWFAAVAMGLLGGLRGARLEVPTDQNGSRRDNG